MTAKQAAQDILERIVKLAEYKRDDAVSAKRVWAFKRAAEYTANAEILFTVAGALKGMIDDGEYGE